MEVAHPLSPIEILSAIIPACGRRQNKIRRKTTEQLEIIVDPSFRQYVEALHPLLEKLSEMRPVTISTLPKSAPRQCIYLFSEAGRHLYVGRTRRQSLRQRLRQHSVNSAQQNQAVFAFKLARDMTGHTRPGYTPNNSRKALAKDPAFAEAFAQAKNRIRQMDLRYVAEEDPLRQTLLEIYVAFALKTPYNDFDTH